MYHLLHGAKKNVGDFLIYDRARRLAEHILPGPFQGHLRSDPLDDRIDEINRSKAILLCGGPGYRQEFYPQTFRLTQPLDKIEVPIVPLGLGWSGRPLRRPHDFHFSDTSRQALDHIHGQVPYLGARDDLTVEILKREGYSKARLVGCPAWYHLPKLDAGYEPPRKVERLVFTPPQNTRLRWQAAPLMVLLRDRFPDAKRYCVFHAGWGYNRHFQGVQDFAYNQYLRLKSHQLGFEAVNAAADLGNIDFNDTCDLHVGYRLHPQIDFFSRRKPSILLHEDGRGAGLSKTFDIPDIDAWEPDIVQGVAGRLDGELEAGFERYGAIFDGMRRTYPQMEKLLQSAG